MTRITWKLSRKGTDTTTVYWDQPQHCFKGEPLEERVMPSWSWPSRRLLPHLEEKARPGSALDFRKAWDKHSSSVYASLYSQFHVAHVHVNTHTHTRTHKEWNKFLSRLCKLFGDNEFRKNNMKTLSLNQPGYTLFPTHRFQHGWNRPINSIN